MRSPCILQGGHLPCDSWVSSHSVGISFDCHFQPPHFRNSSGNPGFVTPISHHRPLLNLKLGVSRRNFLGAITSTDPRYLTPSS
ncbi:hypothetical protein BGZ60DRAFT_422867 [Tricladium varicosporioides]|nr:hypothetical protein BGZ60DRAFT_422867 [Hymenoscyphus varicosporioides]